MGEIQKCAKQKGSTSGNGITCEGVGKELVLNNTDWGAVHAVVTDETSKDAERGREQQRKDSNAQRLSLTHRRIRLWLVVLGDIREPRLLGGEGLLEDDVLNYEPPEEHPSKALHDGDPQALLDGLD